MDADVQWLDSDEVTAWIRLMALLEILPNAIDTQLKQDSGMNRFEYMVMAGLSDAPEHRMAMSDLALFSSGSLSRLSHAITRLESKGWVERKPCGVGRRVDVTLTDAGAAANAAAAPGHAREARRLVVDALTRKQLLDLGRAARAIVEAVDPAVGAAIDEATRRVAGG